MDMTYSSRNHNTAMPIDRWPYFEAPSMASLQAFATVSLTTVLAGILICSPVAGLRPSRALRLLSLRIPRPGIGELLVLLGLAIRELDERLEEGRDLFLVSRSSPRAGR